MYAHRYARPEGIKPGSLTIAIATNAALIGALVFASPEIVAKLPIKTLTATNIFRDPPPEPIPPETKAQPQQKTTVARPERVETTKSIGADTSDFTLPFTPPLPPLPPFTGTTVIDPPTQPPVLTGATFDQRYARDLQPDYPAGERRAEREGVVRVRIAIDAEGRVTSAECVSAASDAFCRATRAQALAKWRFRPATRDGVAVPAVQTLSVRFTLES